MLRGRVESLLVKDISDKTSCYQSYDNRQWNRRCGSGEGHARNKDNTFNAFTGYCEETKKKDTVFAGECLQPIHTALGIHRLSQHLAQSYLPLLLHFSDAEERGTNNSDNKRGNEIKHALIIVFSLVPEIRSNAVEGANNGSANDKAKKESDGCPNPNLYHIEE